jgi:hypothetical protein
MKHEFFDKLYPPAGGWTAPANRRIRPTGEFRCPRKGEWFLSGAIVEGHQAKADMSAAFYIGELVEIKRKITEEIIRVINND